MVRLIIGVRTSGVALVFGWVLMAALPVTVIAQVVQPIEGLPTSMVTRLAEAADGYRLGTEVWIVASPDAEDGRVLGVYTTPDSAIAIAAAIPGAAAFGPLATRLDWGLEPYFMLGCHVRPSIDICPWEELLPRLVMPLSAVDSVNLTIFSDGQGEAVVLPIDPMNVDALFFTVAAIDKFMLPYYSQLYGPEFAIQIRERFGERIRNR